MESGKSYHPINQHYVPQFILRNFCFKEDHLYCFDKWTGNVFAPNIRNIASERFFNDLEAGNAESSLEYPLTDIEASAAAGIRKLKDERDLRSLSEYDLENVATLVAFQIVRTKNTVENVKHVNREIARILREQGSDLEKVTNFREFKNDREAKESALFGYRTAIDLIPQIRNKKWILYTSSEQFVISDNPVVRQNKTHPSKHRGTLGLKNKGIEVYFPLSPSVALCLFCKDTFDHLDHMYKEKKEQLDRDGLFETRNFVNSVRRKIPIECLAENVENLNSLQVISSERFLFSSKSDFELAQEMILTDDRLKHGTRTHIE